ncbi:SDR family NAD(P)-dependent oxidoreductase [Mycobacterium sp. AZCC_0083]|uniref:SDR family NAD(P)-dependent oxidoreductase n=1 Tax=Mycobacterium sp. AZCC_0083 TaxID=2735882 RepID=UPI00161C12B6|nr:SDR family oxidoreductase [Mycobacterium sp. AZCC_0083]MBB5163101.1 NAD(P)-dependent dehydrogenase (short-subunit alcohol dehydrogenase family) [Mycobacterium sp. AZCC_0083]
MGQLEGKTALVTGASTGIGFATARRFVAEGARVFITGRRRDVLVAAAEQLGERAIPVVGDVSDPSDRDRLFDEVSDNGAGLDVVFANAGLGELATIDDLTPKALDYVFGVNVGGTVFTVQKALPLLNEGASIVVTGSSSAYRGTPGFGVYSATKAALRQFVRVWAAELAPRGVRVNIVIPGPTDTPGLRGIGQEEFLQSAAASTALGRLGDPDEVAAAVVFLSTAQSSFMTGSELFADGGEVQVYR